MIKKVEVLANIAVIIISVVLCTVLAKNYLFSARVQNAVEAKPGSNSPFAITPPRSSIQPGTKISLPGIDWGKSNRTLLLALSTNCHYCTESSPFYQQLQQQRPSDLRLVAVLPQTVELSRLYLNSLGVAIGDVVQSPLGSVGVSGTPTLILLDSGGVVRDSWVGKLSEAEATKVISRINESVTQSQ